MSIYIGDVCVSGSLSLVGKPIYSFEITENEGGYPVSNKTFSEIKQAHLQGYLVRVEYEPDGVSSGYGYISSYDDDYIEFKVFIEDLKSNLIIGMLANGEISVYKLNMLPAVSASDDDKFLRVVDGYWRAVSLTDVSKEGA